MSHLIPHFIHFMQDENGATPLEHAIVTGVVTLVSVPTFIGFGVKFLMTVAVR